MGRSVVLTFAVAILCLVVARAPVARADFSSDAEAEENPFLQSDEREAELEMRSERFRLQRDAATNQVVSHLPSVMLVQLNEATTAPAPAAAVSTVTPTAAAPAAATPVPTQAAVAPAPVAAPALVESSAAAAAPTASEHAPFMPGYDEAALIAADEAKAAKEKAAVAAREVKPLPPPAPVSVAAAKSAAPAPVAAAKPAAADADAVTEEDAAELLSSLISRVAAGHHTDARFAQQTAKAKATHRARRHHTAVKAGYGRPHAKPHGSEPRVVRSHARHAAHHHRHHKSRRHHNAQPRFKAQSEADLVAAARARAAALLGGESMAAASDSNADARAQAVVEAETAAETQTQTETEASAEGETESESESESGAEGESETEETSEAEARALADAEAEAEVEAEEAAAAEAEAKAKAAAEAAAAAAKAKAAAELAVKTSAANHNLLKSRFARARHHNRNRMRAGGAPPAAGYGPPNHFPPDTHGAPPVMASTVDLPLNRPPTPNFFYPPTAPPPPAAIQVPRLPTLTPNPAPFAPQYPNMDSLQSHQMNPYGRFPTMAPPMQREPAQSLYPPYSTTPNFEQPAPRSGLNIELPEPAGGAPSLVEWTATIHRNRHGSMAADNNKATADQPVVPFAGFSAPIPQQ